MKPQPKSDSLPDFLKTPLARTVDRLLMEACEYIVDAEESLTGDQKDRNAKSELDRARGKVAIATSMITMARQTTSIWTDACFDLLFRQTDEAYAHIDGTLKSIPGRG